MSPEELAQKGFVVNLSATSTGCCCSISSEKPPYQIFRCQNARSLAEAFRLALAQIEDGRAA